MGEEVVPQGKEEDLREAHRRWPHNAHLSRREMCELLQLVFSAVVPVKSYLIREGVKEIGRL